MRIQVTGEIEPDSIDVNGGQPAHVIEVAAGLVSSVNGHTGGVTLDAAAVGADPAGAADAAEAAAISAAAGDATAKVAAHAAAVDPHGDRAYAVSLVSVDWINVTKAPYGADSTGAVDATTAIQAAATALGSQGGTIYLPPGDFLLNGSSPINLAAPITIQGAGHGATSIRIGSGFTGSSAITVSSDDCMIQGVQIRGAFTTTTSNPVCHGITATGVQEFRLFNTTFQWINGYAVRAIGTAGVTLHGGMIDNVKIQSCAGGIHVKSDTTNTAANFEISNVFTRFLGVNSGGSANLDGIRIEDSWDVLIQNAFAWMNATVGGTGAAFRVRGDCAATFVQNLDALGPQTGAANVIIEGNGVTSPQNVQIQGGVIQQGLIGILISDASNQIRVRNMRILNNQTHNISITSNGSGLTGGIYFDECAISQAGQGAAGSNYDINWTGSADGSVTDCRFGTAPVSIGVAGPQGTINITSAQIRVLNAYYAWNSASFTTIFPGISPQMATGARPDETRFEFRGTANWNLASGERLSMRPTATGNQAIAINVGAGANDNFRINGNGNQEFGAGGASARDTTWGRQGTAQIGSSDSDIIIGLAGKGLRVKEGSNAKMGTAVLNGTTAVTVSTTAVTATSRILLTINTPGGTPASPYVFTRTAGTSFQIKSTGASDTSTVAWMLVEPA